MRFGLDSVGDARARTPTTSPPALTALLTSVLGLPQDFDPLTFLGDLGVIVLAVAITAVAVVVVLAVVVRLLGKVARPYVWRLESRAVLEPRIPDNRRSRRRLVRWLVRLIGWPYRTCVVIEGFEGPASVDVAGLDKLVSDVVGLSGGIAQAGVNRTTPDVGSKDLVMQVSGALADVPHAKTLAGLLTIARVLVRPETLTVRGTVVAPTDRGLGLSLVLQKGRQVKATTTVWQDTYCPAPSDARESKPADGDTATALRRLVVAGAAWTEFQLLAIRGDPRISRLGTRNWESYALSVAAVDAEAYGARGQARELYAKALEQDPNNLPALFNLSVLNRRANEVTHGVRKWKKDVHRKRALHQRRAIEGLHRVLEGSKGDAGSSLFERNPRWYQASYHLAVCRLMDAGDVTKGQTERRESLDLGLRAGGGLVHDLEGALVEFEAEGRTERVSTGARYGELRAALLHEVEGPAIVVLATMLRELNRTNGVSAAQAQSPLDGAWRAQLVEELGELSTGGEGPTPARLVEEYLPRTRGVRGYRTQYALACYYARISKAAIAAQHLQVALEWRELRRWAEVDPALTCLRKRWRDGFKHGISWATEPAEGAGNPGVIRWRVRD